MDIVSHALVGRMFVSGEAGRKDIATVTVAGALPDLFQIPLYLLVGNLYNRPFNLPQNEDWVGIREQHPEWYLWWDVPHSLLFLILIIIPLVYYFKLNKLAIAAYFSHIFLDAFTHTGEYSLKPFFPLDLTIEGFVDAWMWPFHYFFVIWGLLAGAIFILDRYRKKKI